MDKNVRRIISSVSVTVDKQGNPKTTVKLPDRLKALEMLGKHLSLFHDVTDIQVPGLAKLIQESRNRLASKGYIVRELDGAELTQDVVVNNDVSI